MHRQQLKGLLNEYFPKNNVELQYKDEVLQFIEKEPNCFKRELLKGHITGSAFIVNKELTKTVLVHHAKINKWLQPGGHADGETNIAKVALKEAEEETGLLSLKIIPEIFDIDIHTIATRKEVSEHLHYDIRFLIMADEAELFQISHESTDIQWIKLNEIEKYNNEESILRMVNKIK
jgi:8-oxo-dGTP pyrophosphatase MutT (NUDIX family)